MRGRTYSKQRFSSTDCIRNAQLWSDHACVALVTTMILATLALAVAAEFAVAAAFFPALTLQPRQRTVVLLGLYVPIALAPLLVPPAAPIIRFLASVNAAVLFLKLYDLHLGAGWGARPDLRTFLLFLPNWTSMVLRKPYVKPRPNRHENLRSLGLGLGGLVVGSTIWWVLIRADWSGQPFIIEHSAKAVAFFLVFTSFMAAVVPLQRLAGGMVRDFADAPLLARTPADFWRRYNRIIRQFLYEDIFKPVGGRRSPMRATLVAFAVSGLIHEYIFGVTIGRVQGYQTLFFLLQGCAVVATARIKPRGWTAVPWISATLAFNLVSSVLFFASFPDVVGFYSRGLPPWLEGW